MLVLLIACAAVIFLFYTIPAVVLLGLARFVNTLPAWRWLTADSLPSVFPSWLSLKNDVLFYGFLILGTLALLVEYALRTS